MFPNKGYKRRKELMKLVELLTWIAALSCIVFVVRDIVVSQWKKVAIACFTVLFLEELSRKDEKPSSVVCL
jgi:hypothetical protein